MKVQLIRLYIWLKYCQVAFLCEKDSLYAVLLEL